MGCICYFRHLKCFILSLLDAMPLLFLFYKISFLKKYNPSKYRCKGMLEHNNVVAYETRYSRNACPRYESVRALRF